MKRKLKIVYEDKYLIVVNKDSNMLTIKKDDKSGYNLYDEVKEYVKRKNPHNKIFIVHRLDKETCGLILFAKSERVKNYFQTNWVNVERNYYAVLDGDILPLKDRLTNYLIENKKLYVYVTNNKKIGKEAITNYEVISQNKKYSVVKINIETGRKNQIRVQFAYIRHPIVGDKKYNGSKYSKLLLQAYQLVFVHPVTNKVLNLEIPMLSSIQSFLNKIA